MEQFMRSIDSSKALSDEMHAELVQKFQESLKSENWDDVEAVVVASRQEDWREILAQRDILGVFLDHYVWIDVNPVQTRPLSLAIRLAANCCLASKELHAALAQHIDRIEQLLAISGICEVTVGLLANMLFDDNSVLEFSVLLEKGFQETIARQLAIHNLNTSHPMFETAVEIIDSLAEEDMEAKIPNVAATTAAVAHLIDFLFRASQASSDRSNNHRLVDILLRWTTSTEVRKEISQPLYQSSFYKLPQVYELTLHHSQEVLEENVENKRLISKFESILGEFASQSATAEKSDALSGSLFAKAAEWIQLTRRSPVSDKLCSTGYLILCNMCNDSFAVSAVHEHALHKIALAALLDSESSEVRQSAAAFLGNLFHPVANKETLLQAGIIQTIYKADENAAIRLMRRLLSNASGNLVTSITNGSQQNLPLLKDIINKLPDQKALQDGLREIQTDGNVPGTQALNSEQILTKDIASIYVITRRHTTLANQYITTSLIWSLVNLVLLGIRTSNAIDLSNGVFGLGLVLQSKDPLTGSFAKSTVEALQHGDGLLALKQVIEMARDDQANPVAKKVAENATNVLHRLVEELEKDDKLDDMTQKLNDVLKLGLDAKLES
ncbi:uncharacterized protein PV09_01084 [Verruconis gallopava]|uniref:Uncharacterized protein n=1 Tax=Verruconis gallopava TaxID=253628 RepID=A0A0D1XZB5_9PEZI|nr:uncharacterized protein PV09_01084 [Verruconis gallopava]KIW08151.1 hypothetical protein PV09_01084 [Verruconis gallopava]